MLTKTADRHKLALDEDRQTDRNDRFERQPSLRCRCDLARRKMESDLDMKTACEMSAKITDGGSVENRVIARLTPIVFDKINL